MEPRPHFLQILSRKQAACFAGTVVMPVSRRRLSQNSVTVHHRLSFVVQVFDKLLATSVPSSSNMTSLDDWANTLHSFTGAALSQINSAQQSSNSPPDAAALVASETQFSASDTPCASTASCKLKQLAANRCNYARGSLQLAYEGLNTVAHTMGVVVSLLCGCIYVHNVATCLLSNVPPVCVFPYSVYSKMLAGSGQAWEAVKASTATCMIHGDPSVSS
jgi:hypothetical protein